MNTNPKQDMPKHFNASDIEQMPERFRANFINSLSGFKSGNLIGTRSPKSKAGETGIDNLAVVSSVFHVGAHPPLLGMIMRPHSVPRDTLQNIKDTGEYTINHICASIIEMAHQTSARYDSELSEFEQIGLTPQRTEQVNAPYVLEAHIKLGMQVQDIQLLAINQTELVIGQVVEVIIEPRWVGNDGYVDIEGAESIAVSGLDSYHSTNRLARFGYAKTNEKLTNIAVRKL
ncbi:flavin reductase family protein [Glaciecola sp. MF2-115]|uniref:flavin reductase family protein n=1 Tax=Glaciecola sp. MF2-115 TaxID=3384827 RepID=UPI0039A0F73E